MPLCTFPSLHLKLLAISHGLSAQRHLHKINETKNTEITEELLTFRLSNLKLIHTFNTQICGRNHNFEQINLFLWLSHRDISLK